MPIHFSLYPNPFSKQKDEMVARVVARGYASEEEVIERMLMRNPRLNRMQILSVLEEYTHTLEDLLKNGQHIHTPLLKLEASIKGKFNSVIDVYDPRRHQLCVNASPGKRLRKLLNEERAYRQPVNSPQPSIEKFEHFDSQLASHTIMPAMPVRLKGYRLKVNEAAEDEGVYLMSDSQKQYKVPQLMSNKASELFFITPSELEEGSYHLEVRCRQGNSTQLRKHTYPQLLHCQLSASSE